MDFLFHISIVLEMKTGLMYSVSHNIKLLEDTVVEKGLSKIDLYKGDNR